MYLDIELEWAYYTLIKAYYTLINHTVNHMFKFSTGSTPMEMKIWRHFKIGAPERIEFLISESYCQVLVFSLKWDGKRIQTLEHNTNCFRNHHHPNYIEVGLIYSKHGTQIEMCIVQHELIPKLFSFVTSSIQKEYESLNYIYWFFSQPRFETGIDKQY